MKKKLDLNKILTDDGTRSRTIRRSNRRKAIIDNPDSTLEQINRALRDELQAQQGLFNELAAQNSEVSTIRDAILKLSKEKLSPPSWLLNKKPSKKKSHGIPTVFASDWHYGEVVYPAQINGMNEFNLRIADKRIQTYSAFNKSLNSFISNT